MTMISVFYTCQKIACVSAQLMLFCSYVKPTQNILSYLILYYIILSYLILSVWYKTTQIVSNLQVWATVIGSHLKEETTASPVLTKWWKLELTLATYFGIAMHKWLPNLVAKFWLPNLVLYQTAYLILSYLILSYLILSYLILSYLRQWCPRLLKLVWKLYI